MSSAKEECEQLLGELMPFAEQCLTRYREFFPKTAHLRVPGTPFRDILRASVALGEQGGAIVEVNAGPSLLMHIKPGIGKPRPVGQAIVNNLKDLALSLKDLKPAGAGVVPFGTGTVARTPHGTFVLADSSDRRNDGRKPSSRGLEGKRLAWAAVEAGAEASSRVGELVSAHVIPRPDPAILATYLS